MQIRERGVKQASFNSYFENEERAFVSKKNASCCHYGDNCLQSQTVVHCNADSGGG